MILMKEGVMLSNAASRIEHMKEKKIDSTANTSNKAID
ncbi:hypothetical protein C723_0843 [Christiangramia flava JLT2011]|uniref:Uncharacterized protein n=1 Tax=Christiangramia flava JLT2011 TaxID=1229726 RepID=A0A1L7I4F0_9FLAO|nr:hypothetical protein GRFL_1309 [Christiangramia flava JLT2011]OSS40535.1 hypothetical protein C723_0843 [Christiangramia flava JLT2011]